MDTSQLAFPKGRTRKQVKRRKARAEDQVAKAVREAVMARDVSCRVGTLHGPAWYDEFAPTGNPFGCYGPLEWAHLHTRRRSQTRNQAPERRHVSTHSVALCRKHHREYDAHQLVITALTRKGADGPLKFRRSQ